jgi:cobalt-precorrin 5A hydrolase
MAPGIAGDAMGMGEAVIVAGVGCRKGAHAAAIEAAVATALARCGLAGEALSLIATSTAKGAEAGIAAAAVTLRVPVVLVAQAALEAAGERTLTKSERVLSRTGVPSLAEAAALAAAGPSARLIAPRVAVGGATCALAQS